MILYEDLSELESTSVNNLNSFLKSRYDTLSNRKVRNDPRRFDRLSREISANYEPKIIEVLESRIEHEFKTKILLKFFWIAYLPLVAFLGSSQLYQSLNIHQGSFFDQIIKNPGLQLLFSFAFTGITFAFSIYIFFAPNAKKAIFLRILRYALTIRRYPGND
jgi:hypothetical protein